MKVLHLVSDQHLLLCCELTDLAQAVYTTFDNIIPMLFTTVNATAVGTVKDRISGRSFFRKVALAHETRQR